MNKVCGISGCKEAEKWKSQFSTPADFFLLFCLLMTSSCRDVFGVPTLTTSDVAVMNGSTFSLRCSTDTTEDLWWYRLGPGANSEDHIVDGSDVNAKFRSFYSVRCENQESTLTIVPVQFTAATYACVEMYTTERVTAEVTVLESEPVCITNVTGDTLNLTCVVTFTGRHNPSIKWTLRSGKEEKEITTGIVNTPRAGLPATHTLLIQSNERNDFLVYSYHFTVKFCEPDNTTRPTDGRLCVFSKEVLRVEEATGTSFGNEEETTGTTVGICKEGNINQCGSCNVASWHTIAITCVTTVIITSCSFLVFWIYYSRHREKCACHSAQQAELLLHAPTSSCDSENGMPLIVKTKESQHPKHEVGGLTGFTPLINTTKLSFPVETSSQHQKFNIPTSHRTI